MTCGIAAAFAVEVEPTRIELKIPADRPAGGELQVSNRGREAVEVRLSAGPYRFLDPKLKRASCEDWLRFKPDRFTLAPGATTSVGYVVTPPANLDVDTAGEYLAAVLVDQYPAEPKQPGEGKSKVTVVPRIALATYLMIEGRDRVQVELSGLKSEKLAAAAGGTGGREATRNLLKLTATLKNLGTVHVRPSGTYALFEEGGHLYHTAPLGKGMPLLPSASMEIPALLPMPPAGRYRWVSTVEVQEGTVLQKEVSVEITEGGEVVGGP